MKRFLRKVAVCAAAVVSVFRMTSCNNEMKKCIFLFSLLAILLVGCDTNGKEEELSYIRLKIDYMPKEIADNYRVTFNGSEDVLIPRHKTIGKLEVFSKSDNISVLTENNITVTDAGFTFVRPVGKELVLYEENKYMSFTPRVDFGNFDSSKYEVLFNNDVMIADAENYIPTENLPGKLRIVETTNSTEVFSHNLTLETDRILNIMQLSEKDFLIVNDGDEVEPAENHFKVRFFYTADAFSEEKLFFDFYLCDKNGKNETFFKTIELIPGNLSNYIEIDNNFFNNGTNSVNGYFDLRNQNNDKIVDHTKHTKAKISIGSYGKTYKFLTFRFTNTTPNEGATARCSAVRNLWVER